MFVAEALADFSPEVIASTPTNQEKQQPVREEHKGEGGLLQAPEQIQRQISKKGQEHQQQGTLKRPREKDHEEELAQQEHSDSYISFKAGDKILVRQTDQSGWWYGNLIGTQSKGFFPSTFVKCGIKAPAPETPPEPQTEDWLSSQMQKVHQGPVQSEYYQGIIGHKLVKIDDKNKNLLKANYVKFNQATGLASVPIKSQAPAAKAIRQMGYYFDIHEWTDKRNNQTQVKARPDIRKKKKKKLNLILFGDDRERANQKKSK